MTHRCDACRTNSTKVLHRAGAALRIALVRSSTCNPHHAARPARDSESTQSNSRHELADGLEKTMQVPRQRELVTS